MNSIDSPIDFNQSICEWFSPFPCYLKSKPLTPRIDKKNEPKKEPGH